jgi:hypothetical protein
MKKLILLLLFIPLVSFGQTKEEIELCRVFQTRSFASNAEAENALNKIISVTGLKKNFTLTPCNGINNALAISVKGERYIFYDKTFMKNIGGGRGSSNLAILAHEIGHHLNNHALDIMMYRIIEPASKEVSRKQELEADEFAGFVMAKLGATLKEAQQPLYAISDNSDDTYSTHPSRNKRLNAVKKGYNLGKAQTVSNTKSEKTGIEIKSKYSGKVFKNLEYKVITFNNGVSYDGRYEGYVGHNSKVKYGPGKHYFKDGDVYEGDWINNLPNGKGKFYWPNGTVYEGDWVNGDRTGKGKLILYNGEVYEGDFVNGKSTGKGKITWTTGDVYEGDFLNNLPNGKGERTNSNGEVYEGDWVNGDGTGKGKKTWPNGTVYEGNFLNNLPNGKGKKTLTNGGRAEGDWVNGQFVNGKTTWRNGTVYEGGFVNGLRTGKGKYTWPTGEVYEGDFVNNLSNGKGKYTWPTGEVYEGDFVNGDKTGKGKYTWPNGDVYEGDWVNNNRSGYGEIYYAKTDEKGRKSYKGKWFNDKQNGKGTMVFWKGRKQKGRFKDNQFQN